MSRATNFGVGLTLTLIGFSIFWWIYRMDPHDNTPVAVLLGSPLFCIGAILVGRTIWPPSDIN